MNHSLTVWVDGPHRWSLLSFSARWTLASTLLNASDTAFICTASIAKKELGANDELGTQTLMDLRRRDRMGSHGSVQEHLEPAKGSKEHLGGYENLCSQLPELEAPSRLASLLVEQHLPEMGANICQQEQAETAHTQTTLLRVIPTVAC